MSLRTTVTIVDTFNLKEKSNNIEKYFYQINGGISEYSSNKNPEILKQIQQTFFDLKLEINSADKLSRKIGKRTPYSGASSNELIHVYAAFISQSITLNSLITAQEDLSLKIIDSLNTDIIQKANREEAKLIDASTLAPQVQHRESLSLLDVASTLEDLGMELTEEFIFLSTTSKKLTRQGILTDASVEKSYLNHLDEVHENMEKLEKFLDRAKGSQTQRIQLIVNDMQKTYAQLENEIQTFETYTTDIRLMQKNNLQHLQFLSNVKKRAENINNTFYLGNMSFAEQTKIKSLTILVIALIVIMSMSLTLGLMISKSFLKPIKELNERIKILSENQGDLTKLLPINSEDEIGELCKYFNKFLNTLKGIICSVIQQAKTTSNISEELASTSQEVCVSTKQISSIIEGAATSGNELLQMSLSIGRQITMLRNHTGSIAASSRGTMKSAKIVKETAMDGVKSGVIASSVIDDIKSTVVKSGEDITNMIDKSRQINGIIEVINTIAKRTNLLSLNASIEASHAGEAGKGFNVVATEIRKLAENTKEATMQIELIIKELISQTEQAERSIHKGVEKVETGSAVVQNTLNKFNTISEQLNDLTAMIKIIDNASIEQLTISNDVQKAAEKITVSMKQTSESYEEISSSFEQINYAMNNQSELAGKLTDISGVLEAMVNKFRV